MLHHTYPISYIPQKQTHTHTHTHTHTRTHTHTHMQLGHIGQTGVISEFSHLHTHLYKYIQIHTFSTNSRCEKTLKWDSLSYPRIKKQTFKMCSVPPTTNYTVICILQCIITSKRSRPVHRRQQDMTGHESRQTQNGYTMTGGEM